MRRRRVLPGREERDEQSEFPHEIVKKMGAMGLMGVIFPEELGGAGMGYVEYVTGDRGAEPGGWERGDHCGVA